MIKIFDGRIAILLLSILLGIFLAYQMKQNIDDYILVSLNSIQVMKNEVNNNQEEINNIKQLIEKKRKELENYKMATVENGSIIPILEKDLKNIKLLSGMTDVQGPGVYIIMEDNQDIDTDSGNLNNDIVHDIDVLNIINDLRAAGAEAISINGKRIIAQTEVKCAGPIIRVNGEIVANPFIIKAIGDPKVLSAAVNAPNTYGYWLKNTFKIKIETKTSDNIKIPRYSGEPSLRYMKLLRKEGE